MTFYYAKTDVNFYWKPYAQVTLQDETITVNVNDFFTQNLKSNFDRFGYALTRKFIGWDGSRMTLFDEQSIKCALLCLTEYPINLKESDANRSELTYLCPTPWHLINRYVKINLEELVILFQQKFPNIKKIACTAETDEAIRSSFSKDSPFIISLARAGIQVINMDSDIRFINPEFHDQYIKTEVVLDIEELKSIDHFQQGEVVYTPSFNVNSPRNVLDSTNDEPKLEEDNLNKRYEIV